MLLQRAVEHRSKLAWWGVLKPGAAYALSLAGLTRITASTSTLLWATEPLLILLLAWLVLRQRPTPVIAGCGATALVGVLLVVAQPDVEASAVGVALTLAGVGSCAVYTVLSSRYLGDASTLGVVLLQKSSALAFAVVLFVGAWVTGHTGSLAGLGDSVVQRARRPARCTTGVAFWFYLRGLRTCSPAVAGLYINLVPVFGVAAAAVLLDERLVGRQRVGAVIVLGAVTVMAWIQSRTDRPSAT